MARLLSRESAHDRERLDHPAVGSVLDSRFELLQLIATGGMGAVYRACDRRDGSIVALKVLSGDEAVGARRFRREYRAASRLTHPNVVSVHSFHPGPRPFFTMELVPGATLCDWVVAPSGGNEGPQRDRRMREALRQILGALDYIHGCGFIHRDLKPENILVTPDGVVKIMDFGVVRGAASSSGITRGRIVGTLGYMAPEQLEGREVDARADLYSVGALLFELLTGEPPFDQGQFGSLARAILSDPPPSPRSLNPRADPVLSAMATTLLSKRPWQRFASARSALAVLEGKTDIARRRPPLLVPQFVGREVELAVVRSLLEAPPSDAAAAVFVSGAQGSGKTRFLVELGALATARGRRVIAVPPPAPSDAPFASLAGLFAELALPPPSGPDIAGELRALLEALGRTTTPRAPGLLVILDDLDRYDRSSVEVVLAILRELAAPTGTEDVHGLVLLASFTTGLPAEHTIARAANMVRSLGIGDHVALGSLGRDETEAMVRSILGEARIPLALAEWAHRETEGVPALIEDSMRHLVESDLLLLENGLLTLNWRSLSRPPRDRLELEDFAGLAPCARVSARLRGEFDALPEHLLSLVQIASLVGPELSFDLLLAACGVSEDALIDALQELLSQRVLAEIYHRPDHFRFVHERARLVLAARLDRETARTGHLAIARALELVTESERDVVALARHTHAAGDTERTFHYLRPAAERLSAASVHDEAAAAWSRYLEFLPPGSPESCGAALRLAREYFALGRFGEAKTVLQTALDHDPAPAERVAALRQLAVIEQRLGNGAAAIARAYEVLTLARNGRDPRSLARALVSLSGLLLEQAHYREVEHHLAEAEPICRAAEDRARLVTVLRMRGIAAGGLGLFPEAMALSQNALAHARFDQERGTEQLALYDLGCLHLMLGNLERAIACLEESLVLAERIGVAERVAAAQACLAQILIAAGDYAAAEPLLSRCLRAFAANPDDPVWAALAGDTHVLRAGLRRLHGDLLGAHLDTQRAGQILGKEVHAPTLVSLALERSRIALATRRRPAARAEARRALALARGHQLRWFEAAALCELAACSSGLKALAQARRAEALANQLGATLLQLQALNQLAELEPEVETQQRTAEHAREIATAIARKLGRRERLFLRSTLHRSATSHWLDKPRPRGNIMWNHPPKSQS